MNKSSEKEPDYDWKKECVRILRSRNFAIVVGALVLLIILRLGVNFILNRENLNKKQVVLVVHPVIRKMDKKLVLPGNVEAIQQANIYSHVTGYLKKLYVDEGDKVKAGQLLAQIDAPDIVQAFHKAKADATLKLTTRERYKALLSDRVVSQQEFDTIDAEANESQARLESAQADMNYTEIRAPFSGSIARRFKYPGDLITANGHGSASDSPIFILVNEQTLRIVINVPQSDLANVSVGSLVDIVLSTNSDANAPAVDSLLGKVSRMDSLLDESTKTQRVLIDIENKDHSVHAGMFATVTLHYATVDNALAILKEALLPGASTPTVWKVENGKVKATQIVTGVATNNYIEVKSGLTVNDLIVGDSGLTVLQNGASVESRMETPSEALKTVQ